MTFLSIIEKLICISSCKSIEILRFVMFLIKKSKNIGAMYVRPLHTCIKKNLENHMGVQKLIDIVIIDVFIVIYRILLEYMF